MLALADAHITLDEPDLDGLTPLELIDYGVDIGWTATLQLLADRGLLAKETT